MQALISRGYQVEGIEFSDYTLPPLHSDVDVVFPALHGIFGEDGQLQALLEQKNIHYVGSDSIASRLTIDKHRTKMILNQANIPVVPGLLLTSDDQKIPFDFTLPAILKPNTQGSTIGLQLVHSKREWGSALKKALAYDREVLVEAYVRGKEVTVGLIDGDPLPVVEIIPTGKIFDFDAKYTYKKGKTQYLCPPLHINVSIQKKLKKIAAAVYNAVKARDMLRVDMIIDENTQLPLVLEANSIPGFTEHSLFPKAAIAAGFSFQELCHYLVMNALKRKLVTPSS